MRRFSLYRRGRIWYAQIFNPTARKYLLGRPTGESDRRAAEHVVDDWLRDGLPGPSGKGVRPVADVFEVNTILNAIRTTSLTPEDAGRIITSHRNLELVETAVEKVGPGSEPLISFLERFWSYKDSPYVCDKLAHEHRIGRRYCYEMGL